jgi:hypothetical protein
MRAFLFWSSARVAQRHNVIHINAKKHHQHQNLTCTLPQSRRPSCACYRRHLAHLTFRLERPSRQPRVYDHHNNTNKQNVLRIEKFQMVHRFSIVSSFSNALKASMASMHAQTRPHYEPRLL